MRNIESEPRVTLLLRSLDRLLENGIRTSEFLPAVRDARGELRACLKGVVDSDASSRLLAIKILNLLVAKHHLLQRSSRVSARPLGLVVDPSNGCNLRCPGCVHSDNLKQLGIFDWAPGMIAHDRMERFIDEYGPYATHIFFYNYGEPLLNPKTPKYVRMAKTMLLRTVVSTNLSMKRFDAEAYVLSGLDHLTLSIDGAAPETYSRFRRGGDTEESVKPIRGNHEIDREDLGFIWLDLTNGGKRAEARASATGRSNDWYVIERRTFDQPLLFQGFCASSHDPAQYIRFLFATPRGAPPFHLGQAIGSRSRGRRFEGTLP